MNNAVKVLVAISVLVFGVLVLACGDDDDDGDAGAGNACEEQLQIEEAAVTDYCAGNVDVCCLCSCWQDYHSFNNYDSEQFATDGTCVCTEPAPVDPPACEGSTLDIAENCVEDPVACGGFIVETAEFWCEATPLP